MTTCTHENTKIVELDEKCCDGRAEKNVVEVKLKQETCLDCKATRLVSKHGVGEWMACNDPVPCSDCMKKRMAAIEKMNERVRKRMRAGGAA